MPKLLIINPAKNFGSTGKIIEQIGIIAENNGWEVAIAHSARYERPSQLNSILKGKKIEELFHALMSFFFDCQGLCSIFYTKKLITSIKKYNPDIIHLHNIHGYFLNYPLLFDYLASINTPIIWTMHDCWSFTGHCTYFDMVNCEKWSTHCAHCPNLSNYPKAICDRSYQNFELKKKKFTQLDNLVMVPVSEWLGRLTKKSFMGKYPINVIHNGIDLSIFKPQKNTLKEELGLIGKFIVLGVSSNGFSGRKGFDDFIKLSNILPNNYQIIMIGLKPKELKKLPKNIIGKTRTSNIQELVSYYNIADVFINPTYSDNFPTTNIEALACGTPVITYNTGGSPEAIDQETGCIVKQGDIQALSKAIQKLSKHPIQPAKCRERAEVMFDKNICFQKYIHLYESFQK